VYEVNVGVGCGSQGLRSEAVGRGLWAARGCVLCCVSSNLSSDLNRLINFDLCTQSTVLLYAVDAPCHAGICNDTVIVSIN
jgi:hypothetical protein